MKTRVFAIIHLDGKFLLIRETNRNFKNQWYFPGGMLEPSEDLASGLMREVKEEAGYEIGINGICFIQYHNLPISRKGLYVYCSARIIGGDVKTIADEHSMEAKWFYSNEIATLETRGNLPELMQQYADELPLLSTTQLHLNQDR